jgi:hypothetical protein
MSQPQQTVVIVRAEKNPTTGAILGFIFGPLGLLYSNPMATLIMFPAYFVSILLCTFLIGFPLLFCCAVASAIWAHKSCQKHNQALHQSVTQGHQEKSAA